MKKYIVRAVCLAAAFLLLCSTAFAGQTVTLDKYGVSFTVPDGFTWVKTEDAELLSDDVKKLLENDQAIGGMVNKNHDHLSLTIVEDEYINAINYDALSDEKLVALFDEPVKNRSGLEDMEASVYHGKNGQKMVEMLSWFDSWHDISIWWVCSPDGRKGRVGDDIWHTVQHSRRFLGYDRI